jgi:acetylornithine deacetylase/succinyl-diaminopimelate desuccinylase-like protein
MSKEAQLSTYLEFLRFASVSTDSSFTPHLRGCAEWLKARFLKMGLKATIHETPRHPIVVAQNEHKAGRKSLLIYGHYDVQPVDPLNLWDHPPFEPHIDGDKIYARGSADNKGQILPHILGVEAYLAQHKELPLNITFLVEGEEEIGSPNLKPFVEKNRDLLKCDVVLVSDTSMVGPEAPAITYALRGIATCEIKIKGPSHDLHSGVNGGGVTNPAWVAARIGAQLHDENFHVQIPHFYDDVKALADWEREEWKKLPVQEKEVMEQVGVDALYGEKGFSYYERVWARPTAEINGIGGGYQGEGSKTVLPKEAQVKLSFRLVPDQNPERILDHVETWVKGLKFPGCKLEFKRGHSGKPYICNPKSPIMESTLACVEEVFGDKTFLIREGGSIPVIQTFKEQLGADSLLVGLALPDCLAHAPNENMSLRNFFKGIELCQKLLTALAK